MNSFCPRVTFCVNSDHWLKSQSELFMIIFFCWMKAQTGLLELIKSSFINRMNLCQGDACWSVSGRGRTFLSSTMCQHSWKVIPLSGSKTPLADQRRLAHYSCAAERWRHAVQTVHSVVTPLCNNEFLMIEFSAAISGSTRCPFVFFFAVTARMWTTNHWKDVAEKHMT